MSDSPRTRRRVVAAPARRAPAELVSLRIVVEEDAEPDVTYLEQEDLVDRRAAYERGEFGHLQLHAEAEVRIAETTQVLKSPGLAGIESDADEEELAQIASEEWAALRPVLKTVGVATDQLPLEIDFESFDWKA